jgi:diacylglycerol kinase (ATP)
MSDILVIVNPIAGKGNAASCIPEIEGYLNDAGADYTVAVTNAVWHAAGIARDAVTEGFRIVVAAGGDGTANEVICGLMTGADSRSGNSDTIPALGVLPIGRGNDFAYGAEVPSDLSEACRILTDGSTRSMDVGRIIGGEYPEGRYFGNGIGIGFDTIVGLEAAKMEHIHGFAAYVLGAVRTLATFPRAPRVRLTAERWAVLSDPDSSGGDFELSEYSPQVSIMNGRRMGGTFFMAPRARNDDGLLDLCMARDLGRLQMVSHILKYMKGTQGTSPLMVTGRGSRYEIEALEGGLICHADGETICIHGSRLTVECIPAALRLVCRREPTVSER